jgi:hypothetical protein
MHRDIFWRYHACFSRRAFRASIVFSILLFGISIFTNFYASVYAAESASNSVTDIILSNIPVFDISGIFVYGALLLIAFILLLCLWQPKRIPFMLYSLALFYLTRAIFISLTHIGPYPNHTPINFTSDIGNWSSKFFFDGGLFFSAHTGAPFLMALLFWNTKPLRYLFLFWSVFFGVIVLLGHVHYSIDVASAFFITYGIYHIACWLFPKDHALFLSEA